MTLRYILALYWLVLLISPLTGCGATRVSVNVPEAELFVSPVGAYDWSRLEADRRWFVRRDHAEGGIYGPAERFWIRRPFVGYGFIRAEKDGFISSRPQLIDFSRLGTNSAELTLRPTLKTEAERYATQGLVYFEARWVDPEEAGLEHRGDTWMTAEEAEEWDKREAGLVQYEGEWMTPEERDELLRAQQAELGLVEFKGRFVTPAERRRLNQIEMQVATLAEELQLDDEPTTGTRGVATLERSGASLGERARLKFFNSVGYGVEVLVDGERFTDAFDLAAYDNVTIEVEPGTYRIAALPASSGLGRRYIGTFELEGRTSYTFVYSGEPTVVRDLDEVLAQDPTRDIDIPAIEIPSLPEQLDREERQTPEEGAGRPRGPGRGGGRPQQQQE